MTERERKRLDELLAKKEAEEKADKEFFSKVRSRKAEVLKVLGVKEEAPKEAEPNYYERRLFEIADKYGCMPMDLLDYIETERQISYYKKFNN